MHIFCISHALIHILLTHFHYKYKSWLLSSLLVNDLKKKNAELIIQRICTFWSETTGIQQTFIPWRQAHCSKSSLCKFPVWKLSSKSLSLVCGKYVVMDKVSNIVVISLWKLLQLHDFERQIQLTGIFFKGVWMHTFKHYILFAHESTIWVLLIKGATVTKRIIFGDKVKQILDGFCSWTLSSRFI